MKKLQVAGLVIHVAARIRTLSPDIREGKHQPEHNPRISVSFPMIDVEIITFLPIRIEQQESNVPVIKMSLTYMRDVYCLVAT